MNATLNDRQKQVMDQLNRAGEVKVTELKERFDVTEMTVRRDLEKLEQMGLVKRTFGGAILASKDIALHDRSIVMAEEKSRIGQYAAALVQDGEAVFLDGGTTTLQVARHFPAHASITVVTNAVNIAAELAEKKISTIVVGGILVEATNSTVGPIAAETISRMVFDKIFLGATGVHSVHGFSNSNMYEAEIKRLAIQKSRESYVVIDHTKFGEQALFSFADLGHVHKIVSDQWPASEELAAALQAAGTEILLA
ncbi:DeoR faimly transcriptional regulator [Gordoniibacillus kamchatkensis]|uniref:DeoR faimly transcriptional regulator n=1 Tax=Gordoniibacillus kamchatkensis TaxID=1590651 RepID=A0ABR5ABI9_9BACL|nr:DeoR/GlpR family DNA-binding transcription regulator [Paenibacillus sp. VKM B-2647]KIL38330.1 DeoR faimly transcriptional regulator [Paenibacillus sp. VKM B-2647]